MIGETAEPVRIRAEGSAVALEDRRILSRALIAGVLVAAVGLTACGRKGPLEPPPTASVAPADPTDPNTPPDSGAGKPDKPFFLDFLLGK
jgi:predicted small lipoprotein YifL